MSNGPSTGKKGEGCENCVGTVISGGILGEKPLQFLGKSIPTCGGEEGRKRDRELNGRILNKQLAHRQLYCN